MAFTETKNIGDIINATEWNDFVNYTEYISGNYFGHSGNRNIHFPSSNLIPWLNNKYISSNSSVNSLIDVDTVSDAPARDEVLKWNGTNWVPAAYNATFTFSIASFNDGVTTTKLIGAGTWSGSSTLVFTTTYNNGPPDRASVQLSTNGGAYSKVGTMTGPTYLAGTNDTSAVSYPSTRDQYLRFRISANSGTDYAIFSETAIYFRNYVKYGTTTETSGWDSTDINALTGGGTTPTSTYTTSYSINNSTAGEYILFAHPSAYTSLHVSGMLFNSVICPFESPATVSVTNSKGYTENYKVYRATNPALGNSTLTTSTSNSKINKIYWGGTLVVSSFSESNIEGLDQSQVTNDQTQTWTAVTLDASEYFLFCFPSRLSTPLFYDNDTGFGFAMEDPEFVNVTNVNGQTESYKVYRSENVLGPNTITLRTA